MLRSKIRLITASSLLLLAGSASVLADESPFAAIYTTDILPKGGMEIEQWMTWENGRPQESFNHLTGRTEFEYGVTDNFQQAFYLNYDYLNVRPEGPLALDDPQDRAKFTSVSGESIYRLADPYTHPVGVALYLEPAIGPDVREIEAKILLDSHFLDDRLIFAVNPIVEWEWQRDHTGLPFERGTELTLIAGASYRFAPGWFGGVEFEAKREGDGALFGDAFHPAADSFRIGPTLHYAQDNWWVTLGWLAQLPTAAQLNDEPGEVVDGFAHEVARHSVRIRFGIEL